MINKADKEILIENEFTFDQYEIETVSGITASIKNACCAISATV